MYDFDSELFDLYGDSVRIFGNDNGAAFAEYTDFETNSRKTREFTSEEKAYIWAYKYGYRE